MNRKNASPTQKMLNIWAIILIVWAVYRANFVLPEWFDEFVAKPFVFILPVYLYIKRFEKKDFLTGLDWKKKLTIKDFLLTLFIGGMFVVSAVFGNFVKKGGFQAFIPQSFFSMTTIVIVLSAFATAISEEILSRGFVLKRLYEESKNMFTSSFFSSILFFFLHVPILFTSSKITGNLILFIMFTDLLLSLACSFIYLEKKNLTLPILIHAFYNLSIIFFT